MHVPATDGDAADDTGASDAGRDAVPCDVPVDDGTADGTGADVTASAGAALDVASEPIGGEAACWLAMLCPHCGAVPERGSDRCWRCGSSGAGGASA